MAAGRRVKRESTVIGGLPTPVPSYRGSTAAVSLKREPSEIIDLSSDGDEEEPPPSTPRNRLEQQEDIYTAQDFRSPTVSATSSRAAPLAQQRVALLPHPQAARAVDTRRQRQLAAMLSPSANRNTQLATRRPQGLEYLGRKVKFIINTLSELQTFGLSHVVNLPEIVLVGDQSAGKSSLMSALTGVQLPRAQGTCTKCPANITTSPADVWSCKVSLQLNYSYDARRTRIDARSVKKTDPLPPWTRQELQVAEFLEFKDKALLEEAVQWAQLALLNPHEDPAAFIPNEGHRALNGFDHEKEIAIAKFSPNLIAIEISGPNLPSLSLYDLPGMFNFTSEAEDQYLSNVIENLAKDYIKRENALIVWCVAMKNDAGNSRSGKVIRDCGAQDRTVGVLTNPDHLHKTHDEFGLILRGEKFKTGFGYFVTKQPGDKDEIPPGLDYHDVARRLEEEFFDTDSLWSIQWKEFRPRCGTKQIQDFLSNELAKRGQDSMPLLARQIDARLKQVEDKLLLYPDLPETARRPMIVDVLGKFSRDAVATMNGQVTSSPSRLRSFRIDFKKLSDQFAALITSGKPMILIGHASDKDRESIDQVVVDLLSSEDEEDEDPIINRRQHKRGAETPLKASGKRQKLEDGSSIMQTPPPFSMPPSPVANRVGGSSNGTPVRAKFNPFAGTIFEQFHGLGSGFGNLATIREEIKNHLLEGLFMTIDVETYTELCLRCTKPWDRPANAFVEKGVSMVQNHLRKILDDNLRIHAQTNLPTEAKEALKDFIEIYAAKQRTAVQDLYMDERVIITTSNSYLQQLRNIEFDALTAKRRHHLLQLEVEHQIRTNPKRRLDPNLTAEEKAKVYQKMRSEVKEDELLRKKLKAFNSELEVMALVRAYYIVASGRFVDKVIQKMHSTFFHGIRDNITSYLEEKIGVNSAEGEQVCRKLLKEDDSTEEIRKELRAEKEKLVGFGERLKLLDRQLLELDLNEDEDFLTYPDADVDARVNGATRHQPGFVEEEEDVEMDGDDDDIRSSTANPIPSTEDPVPGI